MEQARLLFLFLRRGVQPVTLEIIGLIFLFLFALAVYRGQPEQRHRTTDPACARYKAPAGWLSRRRHDRGRGKSCPGCVPPATGRMSCWTCDDCSDPSHLGRGPY